MTFADGLVSWKIILQTCVELSTIEIENIAETEVCKNILWMKKFLQELGVEKEKFVFFSTIQSVVHLGKNPSFHSK